MGQRFLEAGQVVNTHGIHGEIKIQPWADSPEFLTAFDVFYLDGAPFPVEAARVHKGMVLAKLRGISDVNAAQQLRGKTVYIDREGLELEDGVVFIADLIGLPVYADGREIGRVEDVLTMPGNDVYVVKGQHTYMIPAVPEFLEEVNVDAGIVRVRLIEGMRTDAD